MATNQTMRTIVLDAGADLSGSQFNIVKLNATQQVILPAAVTDTPVGILQNKPASGERAIIALLDGAILKVKCGAAIVAGAPVGLDATLGLAGAEGAAGEMNIGTAIETGVDGETFEILTGLHRVHS